MSILASIRQHGTPVAVELGQTILEAALQHGVPYPHGCRSGNCGACKSLLESGEVELSPYSEFALTDVQPNVAIDAAKFARPAPAKR